ISFTPHFVRSNIAFPQACTFAAPHFPSDPKSPPQENTARSTEAPTVETSPVTAQPPFFSALMKPLANFAVAALKQWRSMMSVLLSRALWLHCTLAYSALPAAVYLLAAHFSPGVGRASTGVASIVPTRAMTAKALLGIDMIAPPSDGPK